MMMLYTPNGHITLDEFYKNWKEREDKSSFSFGAIKSFDEFEEMYLQIKETENKETEEDKQNIMETVDRLDKLVNKGRN